MMTTKELNERGVETLPGYLGIVIKHATSREILSELAIDKRLMAPNGYLHAATVVAIADTSAGYGCVNNLPAGATGFATIELKSNHLGTAREGTLECRATAAHLGKTTQVWDAVVTHRETGRTVALFRCTQMILYAKGG